MDGTPWSCVERFLLSGQTETVVTLEESFKVLKHRLNVEQFSGELPEAIRQDFHAKLFTANLAEALARSAYDTLPEDKAQRYDPNVTYVLNSLKTRLFCWLTQRVSPTKSSPLSSSMPEPWSSNGPTERPQDPNPASSQNLDVNTNDP